MQLSNLIRAVNPAPGAWTTINGAKVDIYDARKVDGTGQPGEILSVTADGMTIAAKSGAVLAKRVRAEGGQKIAAAEFAASTGIKPGDKFTSAQPKQNG